MSVCWLPPKFTLPLLVEVGTIAPLFVIVGPICSKVLATGLKVVPGLIVRLPQTFPCALKKRVLLLTVLSITTPGIWPCARKLKFPAVAAVPMFSVPPL